MNDAATYGQPADTPIARSSSRVPKDPGRARRETFGSREDTLEGIEELREGLSESDLRESKQTVPRQTVREVFVAGRDTDLYYYEIAEKYGVSRATVGRIVKRKRLRFQILTRDLVDGGQP